MENDTLWPEVKRKLEKQNIQFKSTATFSSQEILLAKWCTVFPGFVCGYPMPDNDFGYKSVSFSTGTECAQCGIGLRQVSPIHLAPEPKLGDKDFMAINWTFDIFARPSVLDAFREQGIRGFERWPAIHHEKHNVIESVEQVYVPENQVIHVIGDNLNRDKNSCGHTKYEVPKTVKVKLRGEIATGPYDFARSEEWFGSGHAARQLVFASQRFVQLYYEQKWKGLSFWPTELM